MHLLQIDASTEDLWDSFVGQRASSVTDLSGWRHVVRDSYGIQSYFLAVSQDEALVGTLGLYEIRHPLFGHFLTTAPFATDGGLYYDDERARDMLAAEARRLADQLQVDYLLIRTRGLQLEGFEQDTHYRTAIIDLQNGVDALWTKTLPGKTRNQVRRGTREGFTLHAGADQLADFYRVFHRHMRDLGSPAHAERFYHNIERYLGRYARFIVVRDEAEIVAGALLFELNGTAMNLHTVSLMKYNRRCPNYLLYWDMIKGSCERGNTKFDMGRSESNSTNLKFKKNWGAEVFELNYNYYLRTLSEVPYVDPRNPRYRLPIAVWKKLPLPVTGMIGPWLIRGLP